MSTTNLDFISENQPSFFIHFAYENVSERMIVTTLEKLNLGIIRNVSFKPTTNKKNEHGNSIVVHFERWFRNDTSDRARQKLISGESIRINYTPKAYLQVVAYQAKPKFTARPTEQPTITFENDYGPRLGPNHVVRHCEPKVKRIDSRKEQKINAEQSRFRPSSPECPPPQPKSQEPKPVVYHTTNVYPDIYDDIADSPSKNIIVGKEGIIMPTKRRPPTKKPVRFVDTDSDSDESESDGEILYGDL
jgi:hypothetical protein